MAVPPARSSASRRSTGRKSLTPPRSSRSSGRFSRSGSSVSFRPPIILEWSSWAIRVGHAEQSRPQHILTWDHGGHDHSKIRSQEEWYYILSPLMSRVYDHLMVEPSTRRVVLVCPPLLPSSLELALHQALWNLGVPALTVRNSLETVPYAMGWKRGMVLHVGRYEAHCQVHVDGHALRHTLQVVPCGYERVVATSKMTPRIDVGWTHAMNRHWLDDRQPNSLMMALLKCLEACPRETRRHVVSNLVFVGEAPLLLPDLSRRVGRRLIGLLKGNATPVDEEEGEPQSDITVIPTVWMTLAPLADYVAVVSTHPFRPDVIPWIGASLWAAAWHRHDDTDDHVAWNYPPTNE